jgi:hypothetical protein
MNGRYWNRHYYPLGTASACKDNCLHSERARTILGAHFVTFKFISLSVLIILIPAAVRATLFRFEDDWNSPGNAGFVASLDLLSSYMN